MPQQYEFLMKRAKRASIKERRLRQKRRQQLLSGGRVRNVYETNFQSDESYDLVLKSPSADEIDAQPPPPPPRDGDDDAPVFNTVAKVIRGISYVRGTTGNYADVSWSGDWSTLDSRKKYRDFVKVPDDSSGSSSSGG
eukprot:CAMPEP_0198352018 /NCGR_PEP_ID=MMETSP1450-20131203/105326_1 /TAXON_ID=753684 ORGANISM="Madagascaria erythrocladiodes, Strain CCMP3234" /NCGR_SAMPLE_ID=MMETSP1450 /ASSEMBLY_ACC=CAM_ASM_001115 /LENGTH=137 /DNA_ID=CAMNT_0044058011 /DNA_START=9 /DNA_END=419 /DNA_ORIENTATION=+